MPGESGNPLLEAALAYARAGWRILPLHTVANGSCTCGKTECAREGKHPLTRHGVHDATLDEATIRRWWTEAPSANVGIATGAESGIFVVGPDGPAGIEALAELGRPHPLLPPTP